jgi:2-phosphosulfolactate phosphatase
LSWDVSGGTADDATVANLRTLQASEAEQLAEDETAIVVDVLRASTTITVAVAGGAREVVPVETPDQAREVAQRFEDPVLVGERARGSLDGFVDNSPAQVAREDVDGRPVVLTTTNGTRALLASQGAGRVLVGCMANAEALRRAVAGEDVALVAAGWQGARAEDDDVCCTFLAELCTGGHPDPASTAEELERSTSARKLREAGKGEDVDVCLAYDRYAVVPELDEGSLIRADER